MNYRPLFHLSAPAGRLNDPNGVFIDGDNLHVYYQHDPCFPHAAKQTGWGHAVASLSEVKPWRYYPVTTPVAVSNSKKTGPVLPAYATGEEISFGEALLTVDPKPEPSPAAAEATAASAEKA